MLQRINKYSANDQWYNDDSSPQTLSILIGLFHFISLCPHICTKNTIRTRFRLNFLKNNGGTDLPREISYSNKLFDIMCLYSLSLHYFLRNESMISVNCLIINDFLYLKAVNLKRSTFRVHWSIKVFAKPIIVQ